MSVSKPRPLDFALLCLLATLWGASYSFIKIGVATIPPITFIAGRTLIAGFLLLVVLYSRGRGLPWTRKLWWEFFSQACLNSVVPFTLITWAEQNVDAGLATILNSTTPIFTFLLALIIPRAEAITARKLFGVLIGLIGTALIIGGDALNGLGAHLWSEIAIVAATLSYGAAAIMGRRFHGFDPMIPAAGSMLAGSALLIPLSLVVEQPWTVAPSLASLLALLGLAILGTGFAFVLYFHLIKTMGSVSATAQAYLRVPIGVAFGMIFLGESLPSTAWIGLICTLSGVAAMTIPARRSV